MCDWNESNWKNIACTAANACGNGTLDTGEACDDGNADGTDGCTTACTVNVCGDGYLYRGSEECDEGGDNGTVCGSAYGSSCTYCSTDCRYVASTGSFCGDGVIEGDEYCDAGDIPLQYYSATYKTVYSTCSSAGSTSFLSEVTVATDLNGDGDDLDTGISMTCAAIGVCNGGEDNGDYCSSSSNCTNDTSGATDGTCVFATCSADCSAACPATFESESVLMQKEGIFGSSRSSSVTLNSYTSSTETNNFLITGNATTAYIPACHAVQSISVDIDDRNREYPNVY
ncbi:MAG: hypothetical protein EBV30_10855, partial [Actinobacteria bacterium]|nr:hypothetical protein [Actinomycetota bacterium]